MSSRRVWLGFEASKAWVRGEYGLGSRRLRLGFEATKAWDRGLPAFKSNVTLCVQICFQIDSTLRVSNQG